MKPALILLTLLGVAAGATAVVLRAARPAPPPVPALPAHWTDPGMVDLVTAKRKAVEAAPRSGTAWGELGEAFDAHEEDAAAEACYRAAMRFDPADPRWPYLTARLVTEKDPDQAVALLNQCLALPPPTAGHKAAAELTLGTLLVDQNRGADGDALVRRVYAANPGHPWAAFRHGAALAAADDPAGVPVLLGLARSPYAQRKAAAALAAYHRRGGRTAEADGFEYAAFTLPPDHAWPNPYDAEVGALQRGQSVLIQAVSRHEAVRDYPAAVAAARQLADLYPSPRTQLVLGRALVGLGDFPAAASVLSDAVAADPGLVMAHAFLGVARFGLAEEADAGGLPSRELYAQAVAALDQAVALKADYAPGYYYRAKALAKLGRPDDAVRAIRECIDRRPEEWEGYVVLGEVLAAAGRRAEAVAAAEQAVTLANPADPRPKRALEKLKAGG